MDIATQMVDGVNPTRVLRDGFGRIHKSLRLSVTDRCNLRCTYCMPTHDPSYVDRFKLLTFEEMHRVVGLLVGRAGITKVRLTGGEPLLRKELWRLVEMLSQIPGLADLSLTTNAVLLADHAVRLRDAGLQRINISLDTLDPKRFQQLARRDQMHQTLAGIHAAIDAGF
ncbi:MAG: radical SAM protein, partial [Planctomycetota bacterium]